MTFLTDANKRLIKVSDIYPEDVQLAKGDYIIRAQLRHDDTGLALLSLLSFHFPLDLTCVPKRYLLHHMQTFRGSMSGTQ